jgi:hypothetical protein
MNKGQKKKYTNKKYLLNAETQIFLLRPNSEDNCCMWGGNEKLGAGGEKRLTSAT